MTSTFWNERFGQAEYVYGKMPNVFFAEQLQHLSPGHLLLPCEGEGRNAIFARQLGWDVLAFDSSTAGREKALQLAQEKGLTLDYQIADATQIELPEAAFDVLALVYAHFPVALRAGVHARLLGALKPGGVVILEGFHVQQLGKPSGGPKDVQMLFSEELLREDFADMNITLLQRASPVLNEGKFHQGAAEVIRLVGTKK